MSKCSDTEHNVVLAAVAEYVRDKVLRNDWSGLNAMSLWPRAYPHYRIVVFEQRDGRVMLQWKSSVNEIATVTVDMADPNALEQVSKWIDRAVNDWVSDETLTAFVKVQELKHTAHAH